MDDGEANLSRVDGDDVSNPLIQYSRSILQREQW
jgi:hypothetical protein